MWPATLVKRLFVTSEPEESVSAVEPERQLANDKAQYPLHFAVFNNDLEELRHNLRLLVQPPVHHEQNESLPSSGTGKNVVAADDEAIARNPINQLDAAGNTPLHIAVWRDSVTCASLLLTHGANVGVRNSRNWSSLDEAISMGNREMIRLLYMAHLRQLAQRLQRRSSVILAEIKAMGDFSLEIDWKVRSWLPGLTRVLPSDLYKVHKVGTCIRVDTTIVDFEDLRWKRGDLSFLFRLDDTGRGTCTVLDNEAKKFAHLTREDFSSEKEQREIDEEVNVLMSSYVTAVSLPTKHMHMSRAKAIALPTVKNGKVRRPDRSEMRDQHNTKVYHLVDAVVVARKRREHLSEEDIKRRKRMQAHFKQAAVGHRSVHEVDTSRIGVYEPRQSLPPPPRVENVSFSKYLRDPDVHLGRPLVEKVTKRSTPATLYMAESFPLSLKQLISILQILAPTNKQFQKIEAFVSEKLPEGFPVQLDLPLFPTVSATLAFQNYQSHAGESQSQQFVEIPSGYVEDDSCFPHLK